MKCGIMSIKECFGAAVDISELYPVLKEFNFRKEEEYYYVDIDRIDELAYIEDEIEHTIDITYDKHAKVFTLLIMDER